MVNNSSPESIQRVLLDQLKGVEGLDSITPEELLADLKELQAAALSGLDEDGIKPFGSRTEEFLVEQVGGEGASLVHGLFMASVGEASVLMFLSMFRTCSGSFT